MQDSVAVSGTGERWYLLNVSPDIRAQLLATPELAPDRDRTPRIRGILLTDAELDHSLGLLNLREGTGIDVWAPRTVLTALDSAFPARSILAHYGARGWRALEPHATVALDERLTVTVLPVSAKRPRYAADVTIEEAADCWVAAYQFVDIFTGGTFIYAPCLAAWPESLDQAVRQADCLLLDGTFWSDGELGQVAAGAVSSRSMGHLPVSGSAGTLGILRRHPGLRALYTHVNNTNPLLDPDSSCHAELGTVGVGLASDGQLLRL